MATEKQHNNAVVLAAVGDITARIVRRIAGNDISTSLNGETASMTSLANLAMARTVNNIRGRKIGGAK